MANSVAERLSRAEDEIAALRAEIGTKLQGRHVSATAPTDADVFKWNDTTKKFEPEAPSTAVAHTLDSAHHTDVNTITEALGQLLYVDATPDWEALAGNTTTTKKFLRQTGDGAVSAVPAWDTVVDGDVPATHSGSAHHSDAHNSSKHNDFLDLIVAADTQTIDLTTGEITFPSNGAFVYLTPQGGAGSDDLLGIEVPPSGGAILFLHPTSGKDITLVHNGAETTGKKMMIGGAANVLLDEDHDTAIAIYDSVTTVWNVMIVDIAAHIAASGAHHTQAHQSDHTDGTDDIQSATTSQKGVASELATVAEANTGTDTARVCTPDSLGSPTRTIVLTAQGGKPRTTSGCSEPTQVETSTNKNNYWVLDFDDGADEYAFWGPIAMPENYGGGTFTARFYWTTTATDTDGVAWAIQLLSLDDGDPIDSAWGTAVVVTDDAQSAAGDELVTDVSGAITPGGTASAPETLCIQVYRDVSDGNDDMTEDARLTKVKLEFSTEGYSD